MRFFRPFFLSEIIYPDAIFRIKGKHKSIFLTFDDGPHPDSTTMIIDILGKNDVEAIFFCHGESACRYPHLMSEIKTNGHLTGNHGFYHLDGFRTSTKNYISNIERASEYTSDRIFRPPYGRMRLSQYNLIRRRYKIFMWDLMTYDFDRTFNKDQLLSVLRNKTRNGSVVVFHDTPGSYAPEIIEDFIGYCRSEGFTFGIPSI